MPNSATSAYRWRFFRAGGFDQVKLETGADLLNLDQLDQKLWIALACPTTGLEFDAKTAALIDSDKDGRIRAPELIAAVKWAGSLLKNADELVKGGDNLPLAAINDAMPAGKQLLSSAKQILANLGKKDAAAISVEDASDANKIFANTVFNGDGVIIAESVFCRSTGTLRLVEAGPRRRENFAAGRKHLRRCRRRKSGQGQGGRLFYPVPARRL